MVMVCTACPFFITYQGAKNILMDPEHAIHHFIDKENLVVS